MTSKIDKDDLVIGAGAVGMAYHLVSEPMRPSSLLQDVIDPADIAPAPGMRRNSQPLGGGAIDCTDYFSRLEMRSARR
jgi:hypothetical protein